MPMETKKYLHRCPDCRRRTGRVYEPCTERRPVAGYGSPNFQTIPFGPLGLGNTNSIAAASTNSFGGNATFICDGYQSVGLTIEFTPSNTITGNLTVQVAQRPDATRIETAPTYTLTIPANGSNTVRWTTKSADAELWCHLPDELGEHKRIGLSQQPCRYRDGEGGEEAGNTPGLI